MTETAADDVTPWQDALKAAALFAVDPADIAGVSLRAAAGPARARWLEVFRALLPPAAPIRRVPLHVPDGRLLGGLDLAATLRAGRPVAERGLLAEADGGVLVLTMAERVAPSAVARLTATLDCGAVDLARDGLTLRLPTRFGIIALDEGLEADERPPAALLDRLAFHVDLSAVTARDLNEAIAARGDITAARRQLVAVEADDEAIAALCTAAWALGIASVRAPLLALRAARTAAALAGRSRVTEPDLALAGRLVLAPRATRLPTDGENAEPPPETYHEPEPAADCEKSDHGSQDFDPSLADIVIEAAQAAIPEGLLSRLRLADGVRSRVASTGLSGAMRRAAGRGRPAGVRQGEPHRGSRLNVVETLRAAAPWQPLRRRDVGEAEGGMRTRLEVRGDDFRVTRYRQRTGTLSIFIVDASGSTALHRLAEAKGAVELLLADCYVRRDRVAMVAFRGRGAELLLPPTRSLVRAKRSLAGLPGGGGTPLAAGLKAAAGLAEGAQRRGETPIIILLTDGSANVAIDGTSDRALAEADATSAARLLRAGRIATLLVDTSPRPRPAARQIAVEMGATYLPLPHADATALSGAVRAEMRSAQPRPAYK